MFFSRALFFDLVKQVSADSLKVDLPKLLEHLLPAPNVTMNAEHIRNLFFGDYGKPDANDKIYDEITDLDDLGKVMDG